MSRGYKLRLRDILDAIAQIQDYVGEADIEDYKADSMMIDSVNMNLLIIGEAARGVPEPVQAEYPEIDWRNIIGLRNIITHEYFRLNLDLIWNVIQTELPALERQIHEILSKEEGYGKE